MKRTVSPKNLDGAIVTRIRSPSARISELDEESGISLPKPPALGYSASKWQQEALDLARNNALCPSVFSCLKALAGPIVSQV